VQLIVKDQRLIAPSDPQVELAACIKKNLGTWYEQSHTGEVDQQLADLSQPQVAYGHAFRASAIMNATSAPIAPPGPVFQGNAFTQASAAAVPTSGMPLMAREGKVRGRIATDERVTGERERGSEIKPAAALTRIRLQFPEIIYNNIVRVQGEAKVEITLGDSMTRYNIEAFALLPETLDWQRTETTLEAVQQVYGELTVSPFVFPGDPVMGRLDTGAASGKALVEVRHDGEVLPLFLDDGSAVTPDLPVTSGSVIRFPVRPGAITATVRDALTGETDVSERYITEPGKLRHIMRRLRLLTPGDEVTLQEAHVQELKPLPGLERPFQFFVEGAAKYPFG
jgi:hypothetical protein